jgi:hypothetical protein
LRTSRNMPERLPFAYLRSAAAWRISSLADIQPTGGTDTATARHARDPE